MSLAFLEHAARAFEPPAPPKWASPADLAVELDPKFRRTPALDLINDAITRTLATPEGRLIVSMPPQEGKSTLATKWTPAWILAQRPETRIVVASYAANVARRMGRLIRGEIDTHSTDLGIRIADDLGAAHEFQLSGHQGGVYAVGIGGGLTSRPADVMLIDDPLSNREQADSEVFRERSWDWWTDVASTRLAPGAPVILILTRWHHDDLAGRLLAAEDGHLWSVVNVPAQADHRPEQGQTDPLDRKPGEYMVSARGRTAAQWDRTKTRVGPRTWASLYQGRPSPDEGDLFPAEWSRFSEAMHIERADGSCWIPGNDFELVQSWDMTFKDKKSSDYVVGQVWLRLGVHVYLLDQIRSRLSFNATVAAVKALSAKWPQAIAKFIEDKANGPAVMNSLSSTIPGMIPIEPEGSKYARAAAVSTFVHSNNVHLPTAELLPNVEELVEEAKTFPNGSHDDTIDAFSQAVNRLLLMPLLDGDDVVDSDDFIDDDPRAWMGGGY